jgi:ribosome biogenesis protein YTM1
MDNSHSILYECRGHTDGVECIALNADGDRFASGSADSMIKIWTTTVPKTSDHIEEVKDSRKKRRGAKEERILKVLARLGYFNKRLLCGSRKTR